LGNAVVRERPYNPLHKSHWGNRVVREGVVVKYPQRGETKNVQNHTQKIERKKN
jgi:hypothetical protein